MNTTVSETTTVESTKRHVRPNVVKSETPVNTTVSETTTIEAIARPADPVDPAAGALQDFVLRGFSAWPRHFSNPVKFDTRCSCTRSSGGNTP